MTPLATWMTALLCAASVLSGCASSTPDSVAAESASAPVDDPVAQPPPTLEVDEPEPTRPESTAPAVLLETDGNLDGAPGNEHLVLRVDGSLEAGGLRGRAEIPEMTEYWRREQAELSVIVLDRRSGHGAVLVTLPIAESEDPPNRYQVFVPEDGSTLRRVLDITIGAYGVQELLFSGDGTARYLEDGWTACDRLSHPGRAPRQRVTLMMDGDTMVERSRRNSGQVQICDMLAACPYVYVYDAEGPVLIGEILRDLRGRANSAEQSLSLAGPTDGSLRLRIAEEKPEITYLDEVYLEVDDLRIPPRSCTGHSPRPAYCLADGDPFVMRQGDTLELTFDASAPNAELRATGYYVPTR